MSSISNTHQIFKKKLTDDIRSNGLIDTPIEIISVASDDGEQKYEYVLDQDYYFSHSCNGIVFKESDYYPMIEFKTVLINKDISEPIRFKDVQFRRGWFILDGKNSRLEGPVRLNNDKIKTGLVVIDDKNFPMINGSEIESLSNETESMIPNEQIPHWMIKHMVNMI
jgi:hypothetical protein